MLRLVIAELHRLVRRRLTLLTLLLVLLGLGLLGWAAWESTKMPSQAQQEAYLQSWQAAKADWDKNKAQIIKQCEADNALARQNGTPTWPCTEANIGPGLPPTAMEPQGVTSLVVGLDMALAVGLSSACLLIGASFVGAEFGTGNIGSWLVFEPRRSRVFWAKLLALALGCVALCLTASLVYLAGVWLVAQLNHLKPDLTPRNQLSVLFGLGRVTILATAAGLAAAGLAFLTRHTAAVVALCGVWLGFTVVVDGGSGSRLQRWGLLSNFEAWMTGKAEYTVEVCDLGRINCTWPAHTLDRMDGAAVLFGVALLAVALGWAVFHHRDVN
ncbi:MULTISPECIES: hypothetical protein [unclassified Luteococcus]|uniref:hypothetical protein n=1 Tax=unclassified Luteococcus TaxID=2639923 RepID=UPI00313BF21C